MNESQKLKLAQMTIKTIENYLSEKDSPMSTCMGKLIAVETAVSHYKFYSLHPNQIPPYVMDDINAIP